MRLLAAVFTAVLLSTSTGASQEFSLTFHRLQASDLPVKDAPFTLYCSPGAETEADRYAAALGEAVAWFREAIGWEGRFAMAVLDAADYERYAGQTYPVPFAEVVTGLVVMPDSIATFPGFDAWGLDAVELNANLTLHEIGHAIAHDIGLWSSSHWVNELVANVFLAAYLRAEQPDNRLLDGVPPGFADAARTTNLVDLDDHYAGVGLDNYAWFQFRLATMADHLAADADFAELIAALTAAFPAEEAKIASVLPTPEEALRRLEAIAPGISALAADLLGRPDVPEIDAVACGPDEAAGDATGVVLVENRGSQTLRIDTREEAQWAVRLDFDDAGLGEAERDAEIDRLTDEALATGLYAWSIPPNHRRVFRDHAAGTQLYITGGGCLMVPDGVASFVWTDG